MIYRRKLILQAAMLILIVTSGAAGEEYDYSRFSYKTQVFGTIGSATLDSNDSGLVGGGGVVFRPYPKAGFELQVRRFNNSQEYISSFDYSRNDDRGTMFTGTVHYYLNELRFQPYLLLGGGYGLLHSENIYRSAELEYQSESDDKTFLLEAGGGVNIFVTNHLSIRPDVRLTLGVFSVLASLNVCYHW